MYETVNVEELHCVTTGDIIIAMQECIHAIVSGNALV